MGAPAVCGHVPYEPGLSVMHELQAERVWSWVTSCWTMPKNFLWRVMIDMHIVFIDWFYSCPQAGRREVGTGARMCTRAWELNSTPTNKMLQLTHLKMHLDIVSLYNLGNWHVTWVFMVTEYIYRTVPFMIMQENGITTDEFLFSLSFSFFTAHPMLGGEVKGEEDAKKEGCIHPSTWKDTKERCTKRRAKLTGGYWA